MPPPLEAVWRSSFLARFPSWNPWRWRLIGASSTETKNFSRSPRPSTTPFRENRYNSPIKWKMSTTITMSKVVRSWNRIMTYSSSTIPNLRPCSILREKRRESGSGAAMWTAPSPTGKYGLSWNRTSRTMMQQSSPWRSLFRRIWTWTGSRWSSLLSTRSVPKIWSCPRIFIGMPWPTAGLTWGVPCWCKFPDLTPGRTLWGWFRHIVW